MNKKALAGVWATCAFLLLQPLSADAAPDVTLLPGTVEAELFDAGPAGVSYHDTTVGNTGTALRTGDVDVELSSENRYNVGWVYAGEWLNYSVNVASGGSYLLEARVASLARGGTFHVAFRGTDATGPLTIPQTGWWQTWTTVSKVVTLSAGAQMMRVAFDANGPAGYVGNLNWIRLTPVAAASIPGVLTSPASATTNVVIHASDIPATSVHGAWTHAADSTSPQGIKLTTANLGQTNLTAPPGRAVDYVDVRFNAVAATPYRVALRLKSRKNSRNNDSVWVQFSNALVKGVPAYTLKSTGGLLVNLASDGGESTLIGWGWQSGAYWLSQPATVTFRATGVQLMRIQFREDGVELDQIVLSPTTYLTSGPGRATNDSTIVPKSTAGVPPPVVAPPVVAPPVAPPPVVAPPVAPLPIPPPPPPPTTAPRTWTVAAGGDLQATLNSAQPGDSILLQAGATFTGNFVLPVKSGASFITVRSSAADASLPGPNTRMNPSYAPLLPKIKSPNSAPALSTAAGAHHYRLQFLEFPPTWQGYYDIVTLGDGSSKQNALSMVPYQLVLDRVYVHGDPVYGQKRGVALNSASTSVLNSHISGIRAVGQDSQAVGGWNGPGPFTIVNNYLEAAGENILFGGADPAIPNLVPSDILIRRNHLTKPLSWRNEPKWTVKNVLELKNAQRVVIDGNIIEHNWLAAQNGYAVLFTPRNQDGRSPWSVVQDVQFTNNVVRHVASAINILGTDNIHPSKTTNNILIRNNLFENINGVQFGGQGRLLQMTGGGRSITVDHNTVLQDGWAVIVVGHSVEDFVFTHNIAPDYSWAISGDAVAPGNATIAAFFPMSRITGNVFAGGNASRSPVGNYYPASLTDVRFVRYVPMTGGNYRLALTSLYWRAGSDGKDIGVDIDALNAAAGTAY